MSLPKLVTWLKSKTRSQIDLAVIAATALPLYLFLLYIDAFDLLHYWSRAHESWQLDELFALAGFLGVIAIVFGWRRLRDLTREEKLRQSAENDARRDLLTGLPNRRCFMEEISKWAYHLPENETCAIFLMDLDRFKPINDLYGHRLGDEALRVVASRLVECVDCEGLVARLAGDEFGILIRCPKGDDTPVRVARRIVHAIPKPIILASLSIQVGISVGVTLCDNETEIEHFADKDGSQVETAIRQADMAMYRAKTEGRGDYRFFDRTMDERLQQRMVLKLEIGKAIALGEIIPYYQPLVDLLTHEVAGYEVLARWQHPTRGLLLPEVFIPIAEDTGVIGDLTYALLARAVKDAKTWPSNTYIALNLSARQFADAWLAQNILGILVEADFPPHRLEVEITESAMVQRWDETKSILTSLRNIGVCIALDDFGTGYAGLHHLRELYFDTIKIDQSFVSQMIEKPQECKMVKAMIGLGHGLGLTTTAEGIETEEVLEKLIKLRCNTGQGYLFGQPSPTAQPVSWPYEHAARTRKIA